MKYFKYMVNDGGNKKCYGIYRFEEGVPRQTLAEFYCMEYSNPFWYKQATIKYVMDLNARAGQYLIEITEEEMFVEML